MNLPDTIESAELQFKQILEDFFIDVYDDASLSSHGIDHHRRVWMYAKELLLLVPDQNSAPISRLPTKLIISCYLHDIGMSVETGIKHGKYSRDLCREFLSKNNLALNNYSDVLAAVEDHDRKDYSGNNLIKDLLTILSVADDLDAFGFTGIFRYSEIYLERGIKPADIGHMIIDNAGSRFDNFVNTFGSETELVRKHKKRYDILTDFFNQYNKQVNLYQFGGKYPSGYCGVIEVLLDMLQKKKKLKDICIEQEKHAHDPVILWFFDGLAKELS
jgi:hypothetical protein